MQPEENDVDLVVISEDAQIYHATIVKRDGNTVYVKCSVVVPVGTPVCLQSDSWDQWLFARVEDTWTHGLELKVRRMTHSERRDYTRVYGGITLLYQVIDAGGEELTLRRWIDRGESVNDTWQTPDPFMDFSGSGLRFHHLPLCKAGDTLLLEFKVPGSEDWHRATGEVIRVMEIPEDDRDNVPFESGAVLPTHWIAIQFNEISGSTVRSLVAFTERIQETAVHFA
ncbi:MAG: hypothetical protein GWP91_01475 [Rhodobacterales bacterium]|nr:hypothetical protein [Rhodobacterales bacterium]